MRGKNLGKPVMKGELQGGRLWTVDLRFFPAAREL